MAGDLGHGLHSCLIPLFHGARQGGAARIVALAGAAAWFPVGAPAALSYCAGFSVQSPGCASVVVAVRVEAAAIVEPVHVAGWARCASSPDCVATAAAMCVRAADSGNVQCELFVALLRRDSDFPSNAADRLVAEPGVVWCDDPSDPIQRDARPSHVPSVHSSAEGH